MSLCHLAAVERGPRTAAPLLGLQESMRKLFALDAELLSTQRPKSVSGSGVAADCVTSDKFLSLSGLHLRALL